MVDIDLGRANGEPFLNVASVGLSVAVTEALSPRLKRHIGPLAWADVDCNGYDTRNDTLKRDLTGVKYTNRPAHTRAAGTLMVARRAPKVLAQPQTSSFATNSPRLPTPTFPYSAFRWSCTVCGEMNRFRAMSAVGFPARTSRQTSRSRAETP